MTDDEENPNPKNSVIGRAKTASRFLPEKGGGLKCLR